MTWQALLPGSFSTHGPFDALAVLTALALDRAFGEPPAWCHPVVAMGRWLGAFSRWLPGLAPRPALWAGALLWWVGAAAVLAVAGALSVLLARSAWPWWLNALGLGLLLKPLLAWRMLRDEVVAVDAALAQSLAAGRRQLARLVSRDTTHLNDTEVREAAIETLAENLNDSVVAPLYWFAVAGLPGAALYRYANTADAMWGYRGRWEWAGKWAARADDVLSWAPARLSALLLCAACPARWPGLRTLHTEAARTPSPNGGWPMGAMALLLGCRLGKPGAYRLNAEAAAPGPSALRQALRIGGRAVGLTALAAVLALTAQASVTAVVAWGAP